MKNKNEKEEKKDEDYQSKNTQSFDANKVMIHPTPSFIVSKTQHQKLTLSQPAVSLSFNVFRVLSSPIPLLIYH